MFIIKIQEIRNYLIIHPKYFSDRNNVKIENIRSNKKYYFIGDCKHEFLSLPCNAFRTNKLNCPYCCGKRILKGFNDMWTINPELASLLSNYEDGYKYAVNTHKKLSWICKDCGKEFYMLPNKLKNRLNKCPYCPGNKSYGEKFLYNLFDQLSISFKMHVKFEWSKNKEYDFYIPELSCIVEVNGKQHYTKSDFSYLGGKHYYEEMVNDEYKKSIALTNGISNYIVIDARKSDMNWLKKSISNSELPILLNFNYEEIMWDKCNEYALSNEVKLICQKFNESRDIQLVANYFHCSYNTVKNKLKQGAINEWCDYDGEKAKRQAQLENGQRIVETMSKQVAQFDIYGNFIKKYPSIQQAQRETGYSHIWDCIKGERKTAGGYQWKYADDLDEVKSVVYKKSGRTYRSVNQYDIDMNFIKTWSSITEAEKETNIHRSNIIAVCSSRQKTAGGFIWRYNDDSNK